MINKKEIKIVGAGISGLTVAIVLAKAGYKIKVFEQFDEVGKRFNEDFQGLENWSDEEDILDFLKKIGIKINFLWKPKYQIEYYGQIKKRTIFHSKEPFCYLVKRGSSTDCLDQGLKIQAQNLGIEIVFGKRVDDFRGDIIACGSLRDSYLDYIAMGYVFKTDISDVVAVIFNDNYAPGSYSYFIVHDHWATLTSAIATDFRNANKYLEKTVGFFQKEYKFKMGNVKRWGGTANFFLQDSAKRDRKLFIGEAAGFQDFYLGFGMRYAFLSGYLAAKSIIENKDYNRLWKDAIEEKLKVSVVNRFLRKILGIQSVNLLVGKLKKQRDMRRFLKKEYSPSVLKDLLFPIARFTFRKHIKNYIY